jgi:1-acyl-sn-glycerol-3-phosphate acyltransferase
MFERLWVAVAGLLLILAALLAVWVWYTRTRTNYTLQQSFWFLLNRLFNTLLWRTRVSGRLPVGPRQGALIVANHTSGIDPLLIQRASDRVVHWMVAGEYWKYPIMAHVFRALGAIPVGRRGVDTAATKAAIRLASQGGLVGLFPEGRVNTGPDLLLPGRPGAVLIAIKARVNIIPVYIAGAPYDGSALGSFKMPAKVQVTIGEPIDLSAYFDGPTDKEALRELTRTVLRAIARLSGDEAFEPQLAGRNWHPDDAVAAADEDAANAAPASSSDAAGSG